MEAIKIGEPETCPSRILKSYVANISLSCVKIKGLSLNMFYYKYLFDIDIPVSLFAVVVNVVGGEIDKAFTLCLLLYLYFCIAFITGWSTEAYLEPS